MKKSVTVNESQTEALGVELGTQVSWGQCIALYGNLGCGKTVFTRGIARGLGIEEAVSSPTFTIVQEYRIGNNFMFHLDLYRIPDVESAFTFGIDEFLNDPLAVSVIEWPERVEEILGRSVIKVFFEHRGMDQRSIKIMLP